MRSKVLVISGNAAKYGVSAPCEILGIARSTYYFSRDYPAKGRIHDGELGKVIERIFKENRSVYGARKIKAKLASIGQTVSRNRIIRIMKNRSLISVYAKKKHSCKAAVVNESPVPNLLQRDFLDCQHLTGQN